MKDGDGTCPSPQPVQACVNRRIEMSEQHTTERAWRPEVTQRPAGEQGGVDPLWIPPPLPPETPRERLLNGLRLYAFPAALLLAAAVPAGFRSLRSRRVRQHLGAGAEGGSYLYRQQPGSTALA